MISISPAKLRSWLYPPTCLLCGADGWGDADICEGCRQDLPYNHTPCYRCGLPLTGVGPGSNLCGRCQHEPPHYRQMVAPFLYRTPLDYLLPGLKFRAKLAHARLLGELLADAVGKQYVALPQRIIPIPLHPRRLRQRGFNQALELARPIASRFGIPIDFRNCVRTRSTPPQLGLSAKQRRHNLHGAFAVVEPIAADHLVLIDDVVTTASTVNELAATLRRAGVERVDVWACARA